jgi:Na+:H+ antiporter, NhaA family
LTRPARRAGPIEFLFENSLFLPIGALLGLAWANLDHGSYTHLLHLPILSNTWVGTATESGAKVFDLHFLVNEVLMAIFFAIAGKEVFEAFLPGGPLNRPREAATPLIATVGGVLVPAGIYLLGAHWLGQLEVLHRGWAIPCATDIAFSYMVARLVFGALHPAIPFLLLLAIVDDAIGLLILAVFYPQKDVAPIWLLLVGGGVVVALLLRKARVKSFWPYLLLAGGLSWLGFAKAGLHPALGLLPVIPAMPHAHIDLGLIDWRKLNRADTLTQFEHWWAKPVQLILALFGLLNAGVVLEAVGATTWLVLAGLILGKPLGIWLFGMLAARVLGFGMPGGMGGKDLLVIGFTAAIGFTVALFVATVAFPPGIQQDAAKMGALLSLGAAGLAIGMGKILGVERKT